MPEKSNCLLVELGYRCSQELRSLVEAAGFYPIVGKDEDTQLQPWVFALLVACTETQEEARKVVEILTARHGLQVLLVLEDPERVDLSALFAVGLADFISPPFSAATVLPRIHRLARAAPESDVKASHSLPADLGLLGK